MESDVSEFDAGKWWQIYDFDDRKWWQVLAEEVYHRALTPYELKGEFERMYRDETGEEVTSVHWDFIIEFIRDWYEGEDPQKTEQELTEEAEERERTFKEWEILDDLEARLDRPLTIQDVLTSKEALLCRKLNRNEVTHETYCFDEWAKVTSEVKKDFDEERIVFNRGFEMLYHLLFEQKPEDSFELEGQADAAIKEYMNFEMWIALNSLLEPESASASLSVAGKLGAEIKHSLSRELKAWAIPKSKFLTGLPAAKARKLMQMLPSDIDKKLKDAGDKFKDPERVIRDALAAQRKNPDTPSS